MDRERKTRTDFREIYGPKANTFFLYPHTSTGTAAVAIVAKLLS